MRATAMSRGGGSGWVVIALSRLTIASIMGEEQAVIEVRDGSPIVVGQVAKPLSSGPDAAVSIAPV